MTNLASRRVGYVLANPCHTWVRISNTQQEAQKVLDQNSVEVNKGLEQLASCLIGHQDAARIPEAIRANLPKEGQILTFKRSLQVNTDMGLRLQIAAERPTEKAGLMHISFVCLFLGLGVLGAVASRKVV